MRRFALALLIASALSPAALASNIPDSYWAEPLPTAMYAATIRDIQAKLKALNCYRGAIDGLAGRGTTGGIRAWQKANDAPQNGIVSEPLMQSLLNAQSIPCKR